jgi:DNA-binding response OmpR family regulator
MRLLYIEDSVEVCQLARTVLGENGITVDCVETLAEARERLSSPTAPVYDILLVDLILPDARDVEAVEALAPYRIPMIVVSGETEPATLRAAARAGADDFLTKPGLASSTLLNRVYFVHSRHVARREAMVNMRRNGRKRLHGDAFEAIKPFISCSIPPFQMAS